MSASRANGCANRFPISIKIAKDRINNAGDPKTLQDFHTDLLNQSKLISQLFAYSWLPDDQVVDYTGDDPRFRGHKAVINADGSNTPVPIPVKLKPSEIAHNLQNKRSGFIKGMLFEQAGVDLNEVLGDNSRVCVDWVNFDVVIKEEGATAVTPTVEDEWYTAYLPYPPRAQSVTDDQLKEWVTDTIPENVGPKYPYIPLSGGG